MESFYKRVRENFCLLRALYFERNMNNEIKLDSEHLF